MAIEKRMIPIPPSHWIIDLQKRILLGRLSIVVSTEAPVVVKPETVSKNASSGWGKNPDKAKGMAPKRLAFNHPKETMEKAWRRLISFLS